MGDLILFLCGDVMTGRGIDQILPRPCSPEIHEEYLKSALGYLELAEQANGPLPKPAGYEYIWGDALQELRERNPVFRIVNLETAVTKSNDWVRKGINYRMSPENAACLTAARIDCCVLANNHILDWGEKGLLESVKTLMGAKIEVAGAGMNLEKASMPAILPTSTAGRTLVFGMGSESSGIPADWAAKVNSPGVSFVSEFSDSTVDKTVSRILKYKRPGDLVILSIHWGGNWGFEIAVEERRFAHRLIEAGCVDIIHGHSSHHVKGIEVYLDKLILYGCGDFIDDYEGIGGYEEFRGDLALMYFPTLARQSGAIQSLEMVPLRIQNFRLNRASVSVNDTEWLAAVLNREGKALDTSVSITDKQTLQLHW